MVNQTTIKSIGLIKDFKIQIHEILYITTFSIMKNNVLNSTYSMLLSKPWLCNARITHFWENNLITIEGNRIVQMIKVPKHLDNNTKHPKVLLCYDLMKGITNEKEKVFLIAKLNLFMIRTITLHEPKILNAIIFNAKIVLKISHSISHILKEIFKLIILQCTSKSQNWILHVGHYQRISK
jgi:hypothetical protein